VLGLCLICLVLALVSLSLGSGGSVLSLWDSAEQIQSLVIEVRLPRVLGCLLAGALLGLGGLLG